MAWYSWGGGATMILRERAVIRYNVRVFRRFSCAGRAEIWFDLTN